MPVRRDPTGESGSEGPVDGTAEAHETPVYVRTGGLVDRSDDESLTEMRAGLAGFLDADPSTVRYHDYGIWRLVVDRIYLRPPRLVGFVAILVVLGCAACSLPGPGAEPTESSTATVDRFPADGLARLKADAQKLQHVTGADFTFTPKQIEHGNMYAGNLLVDSTDKAVQLQVLRQWLEVMVHRKDVPLGSYTFAVQGPDRSGVSGDDLGYSQTMVPGEVEEVLRTSAATTATP